jgi:hypothetical protein
MGSQYSKDNSTDQSNIKTNSICSKKNDIKSLGISASSIGNICNDSSSYNGIIIDKTKINSILLDANYANEYIEKEKPKKTEKNKNSVKFFWIEGGNEVYITGTFCDWKKVIKMNKNKDNIFEKELFLPEGKYEFKFIVDNEWKFSSYYQKIKDNRGITNNYLDNTNLNNINDFNKLILESNKANITISAQILRWNLEDMKKNYNNIIPYKDQLNEDAPKIPDVYEILMDLNENTNQKNIGNEQYLNYSFINSDKCFKSIIQPFHSYLNHLFTYNDINLITNTENNQNNNSNLKLKNKNISYMGINCNIKIKNKYISIVYFSPLNKT